MINSSRFLTLKWEWGEYIWNSSESFVTEFSWRNTHQSHKLKFQIKFLQFQWFLVWILDLKNNHCATREYSCTSVNRSSICNEKWNQKMVQKWTSQKSLWALTGLLFRRGKSVCIFTHMLMSGIGFIHSHTVTFLFSFHFIKQTHSVMSLLATLVTLKCGHWRCFVLYICCIFYAFTKIYIHFIAFGKSHRLVTNKTASFGDNQTKQIKVHVSFSTKI